MFCILVSNVSLVLFPTHHHRQFDLGYFVLVPGRRQRELTREFEERNFEQFITF